MMRYATPEAKRHHADQMALWRRRNARKWQKYIRTYRRKNRKRLNAKQRRYNREHAEQVAESRHRHYVKYRPIKSAQRRACNDKLKSQAIAKMGGKCRRCGFTDQRALHFHHWRGDGKLDRGGRGKGAGWAFHRRILSDKRTRKKLELLCANCHCIADYALRRGSHATDAAARASP